MAIALRNLENKVRGSIGNITFYPYMDTQVVRCKAPQVHNPKTQIQQMNRANMLPCVKAYQSLKPLLYKSLNNRPDNYNVFHQFSSQNLNHSFINGTFQPENFILSGNCFNNDVFDYDYLQSANNNFTFNWAPSIIGYKENSDILCLAYFNNQSNEFKYVLTNSVRGDGTCNLKISLGLIGSITYFYLFFVKSNYSDSGNHSLIEFNNS
jgi:hypothetical protein